jgi:solute carrier family 25 (peroxisomal adenine nucleotide transporter), member 17
LPNTASINIHPGLLRRTRPQQILPLLPTMAALNALGHAVSGSVGTAISTATVYPLDLITTRLKAQRQLGAHHEKYAGVIDALRSIVAHEGGFAALYQGLGPDVAKSVVDSFLFFGFYNYLRSRVARRPRILQELALGAFAGACAKAFTTPISNVVTRKQMGQQQEANDQSLLQSLVAIKEENGIVGLWSGYSATLLLTTNPSITFFVNRRLAERIIPALEEEDIPVAWIAFLLAAWSKATATALTFPLQTGKTRLQMATKESSTTASSKKGELREKPASLSRMLLHMLDASIFGVIIRIIRKEGPRALYAGLQGELLKSFFSHGITMLTKGVIHRMVIRLWYLLLPYLIKRRLLLK